MTEEELIKVRKDFASAGGQASVKKKTKKQMKEHIKMMVDARLKKQKAKKVTVHKS